MGQFHAGGPITDKESGDGASKDMGLSWGFSGMQGWRDGMEDAHIALASLGAGFDSHGTSSGSIDGWADTAMFGVLDGHGGESVALFCQRHLPAEISRGCSKDIHTTLVDAFHAMDEMLFDPQNLAELRSCKRGMKVSMNSWYAHPNVVGCTAVVCCVRRDALIVANAGDSRAVLCRHGQAVPLSEDHKPNLPGELQRISNAGGTVERQQAGTIVQYRVNGNLNLSRSIGDLEYKKNADLGPAEQMICSTPDVSTFKREARDEFIVLCCDGVWDVMGNQDVVDFVRARLIGNSSVVLSKIAEELLDNCVSHDLSATGGLGGDNMTAVIVVFRQGQQGLAKSITAAHPQPISSEVGGSSAALDDRVVAPSGLCSCKMV
eukprot:TRINITY_DN20756_c0_g1_i2.p1 TRINITY_DN20756_c0_g1~~TRINITY_DN20756_c0_g1_i2.p1  ORF type:complete len:377 (+),score=68.22 TRINITY_DN20756_c0_g1_i2:85-1215(+)